jgi:hypothetical protein
MEERLQSGQTIPGRAMNPGHSIYDCGLLTSTEKMSLRIGFTKPGRVINFSKVKRPRSEATFTLHEPTYLFQGKAPANPELHQTQYVIRDFFKYSLLTTQSPHSLQITIISAPH